MRRRPGQSAVSFYLGCTMYVAAAMAEARPDQKAQLREALQPLIETRQVDAIAGVVDIIMGPDWRPHERWRGFWSEAWTR